MMNPYMNKSPTSEVGSVEPRVQDSDQILAALEAQSRNLIDMRQGR